MQPVRLKHEKRFPQLRAGRLAVVSNTGQVWLGDHAWIVSSVGATRLSRPRLQANQPIAFAARPRGVLSRFSKNRVALSSMLRLVTNGR